VNISGESSNKYYEVKQIQKYVYFLKLTVTTYVVYFLLLSQIVKEFLDWMELSFLLEQQHAD
jgi:hypothetical protein